MNHIKLLAAATCILLATAACKKDKTDEPQPEAAPSTRIAAKVTHNSQGSDSVRYYYDDAGRCERYISSKGVTDIVYNGTEAVMTTRKDGNVIDKTIYYINPATLQADSVLEYYQDQFKEVVPVAIVIANKAPDGTVLSENRYSYKDRWPMDRDEYTWKNGDMITATHYWGNNSIADTFAYNDMLNTLEVNYPWLHRSRHLPASLKEVTRVNYGPYYSNEVYDYTLDTYGRVKRATGNLNTVYTFTYADERGAPK